MPATTNRGGRPKTGAGHRDDAMLANLEFLGKLAEIRQGFRLYVRSFHDEMDQAEAWIRESAGSWRFGELVDEHARERES